MIAIFGTDKVFKIGDGIAVTIGICGSSIESNNRPTAAGFIFVGQGIAEIMIAAIQCIGTGAAFENIVPLTAVNSVITCHPPEDVVSTVSGKDIVVSGTFDDFYAGQLIG